MASEFQTESDMAQKPQKTINLKQFNSTELLNPTDVIDVMIDLRIQLFELEQQIKTLQPSFFAACMALNTEKITLEKAIITRKLTPGQWTYSPDILEQEALLKQLKRLFQQDGNRKPVPHDGQADKSLS